MKLQNEVNNVVRSDDFEQSNYTIEASAKAFSILHIMYGIGMSLDDLRPEKKSFKVSEHFG